ncbi:DUF2948 family protein [Paracoccus endophyticus]|uniref:DUF2948 family protein n=1 Tax=Paracoccus endophyticus TaxID=2233774 RepID=UPI000DD51827|nr:DUF2948 family protein [Paracoccus endophyticus]
MTDTRLAADASFAEGDPAQVLAIRAESPEDLPVLAALAQDAVLTVGDIRHDTRARRLALLVSRFRWEDAEAARAEGRPYERVRALLVIGDALRVRHDGIPRDDAATVLSLLDLSWQPGEDGTGTLHLRFAGDGTIAVDAECVNVDLRDVARPHRAVSGAAPRHEV